MKNLEKAGYGKVVKNAKSWLLLDNAYKDMVKSTPKVIKRSVAAKRTSTVKPAKAKDAYKSINKKAGEQASINKHHSKLIREGNKAGRKGVRIAFGTGMLGVGAAGIASADAGKDRKKNVKLAKKMVNKTKVKKPAAIKKPTTTKKK
jgi:hypothetical protein